MLPQAVACKKCMGCKVCMTVAGEELHMACSVVVMHGGLHSSSGVLMRVC